MNRAFRGIWIPSEIWLCKDLTIQEKLFLVEIDSLDNENGCTANNQYFSDFFEISKTRVSLVIKHLLDKGFLNSTIVYKENSKQVSHRVLNICRPPYPTKVIDPIQQKLNTPIQQKLKDNNTINNNTYNNTYNKKDIFIPPTVSQVREYCIEKNNGIDADAFIDYYSSKGWLIGKSKMKDWKAAVRTWGRNKDKWNVGKSKENEYVEKQIVDEDGGTFQ